jgi:hypothetical protein
MKMILIMIGLMVLVCSTLALACTTNNAFTSGDNVTICSGNCTYQNETNLNDYIPCDATVSCKLTVFYPNGSALAYDLNMNRTQGSKFNASLDTVTTTGTYDASMTCRRNLGWWQDDFTFVISSADAPAGTLGSGGGATHYVLTQGDSSEIEITPDILNKQVSIGTTSVDFAINIESQSTINGVIEFETMNQKELASNQKSTDGWCYLVESKYHKYQYREEETVTGIPIRCSIPSVKGGHTWVEKVCLIPDGKKSELKCSIIQINIDDLSSPTGGDILADPIGLLEEYWWIIALVFATISIAIGLRKPKVKIKR